MSNRKNYNSIVFLTTLSVYLGLVLVGGATPSVLAQAATTRDFNIKSEIVIEDDLDKKPDGASDLSDQIQHAINTQFIARSILTLLDDLEKLKQIEKNGGEQRFEIECLYRRFEGFNAYLVDKLEDDGNKQLLTACKAQTLVVASKFQNVNPLNFYSYDDSLKAKATNTKVKFLSENGQLSLQITFKQKSLEEAQNLAGFFNQVFDYRSASKELDNYERLIYHNTKAATENNQVFIVTRLPRASIDDLLAEK
jgi:hypothetical protein